MDRPGGILMKNRLLEIPAVALIAAAAGVGAATSQAAPILLMAESDNDRGAGQELFALTFNSITDLLAGAFSSQVGSQLNLAPDYSSTGVTVLYEDDRPPVGVPEPGTLVLLCLGLTGLGIAGRRKAA